MKDFKDEIPGYLLNRKMVECLNSIALSPTRSDIGKNLRLCSEALVAAQIMDSRELKLLDGWLKDVASVGLTSFI